MTPEAFDKLVDDFGRKCAKVGQSDPALCFDPFRPHMVEEMNDLRTQVKQAFRDALSGRWPVSEKRSG